MYYKASITYVLLVAILFISGCKPDDASSKKGALTIKLVPMFGNTSLQSDKWYVNDSGDSLRFSKFKLYLSEISLTNSSQKKVLLKDVIFANQSSSETILLSTTSDKVDIGTYSTVSFNFGVTSLQNNTDPASVSCPNPLCADNDMWWGNTLKYTHVKLEGSSKIAPSFTQNIFIYHVGKNENFRSYQFPKSITISEGTTNELSIKLDLKELLKDFNLATENITQTTDKPVIATKFADKFQTAISVP